MVSKFAKKLETVQNEWRNIGKNTLNFQKMVTNVISDYSDVRYRYCEAREASNRVILGEYKAPKLDFLHVRLDLDQGSRRKLLVIEGQDPCFGPQLFLAIRTRVRTYHHNNLGFQEAFHLWTYLFHAYTFEWDDVDSVGMGSCDRQGFPHVVRSYPRRHGEEESA